MSTIETSHDFAEAVLPQQPKMSAWPEGLPADGMALAKELNEMQCRRFERGGLSGPVVPENIRAVLDEVRKLTYASGPFSSEIAGDLARDLGILRAHDRKSTGGNHQGKSLRK